MDEKAGMRAELAMKTRQIAELSEALTRANRATDVIAIERDDLRAQLSRMIDPRALLRWRDAICYFGGFPVGELWGSAPDNIPAILRANRRTETIGPLTSESEARLAVERAVLGALGVSDDPALHGSHTCFARSGSTGGNDPQDCNWPICGCDPHADKVIAALEESGLLKDRTLTAEHAAPAQPFQSRVQPWMLACFGAEISADTVERNHRFIEEALELIQALGCPARDAHALVDYVYGRPVGDPPQEVGGVMVTLAALCLASGMDMHRAAEVELTRINRPEIIEKIRAKQAAKPKGSALPIAVPIPPAETPRTCETCACSLHGAPNVTEYQRCIACPRRAYVNWTPKTTASEVT